LSPPTLLRTKAPLRISFAGGGTDVSPYPEERGGAVLNCTVNKYAYATLATRENNEATTVHSLDFDTSVNYGPSDDRTYTGELDLVTAALRTLEKDPAVAGRLGGLEMFLHSDAPPGSGLGGSSTMAVALVGVLQRYLSMPWTSYDVAEIAYRIEREEMAKKGGRQDQYAASFGGFNFMEFGKNGTVVNPLKIPREILNELQYRLLLCYTGTRHLDDEIIKSQQNNYREGRKDTVASLDAMKALAVEMKNNLLRGNIDEMGRLLHAGWELKKRLTSGISNPLIDHLYEKAREAGALGGKLTGAGGGGYLLLFADFSRRRKIAEVVEKAGGHVVDFSFEMNGVQSWQVRS
jgi:D-glycero-alpha-D-manno-heptose-7-phosphate kinase